MDRGCFVDLILFDLKLNHANRISFKRIIIVIEVRINANKNTCFLYVINNLLIAYFNIYWTIHISDLS